MQNKSEVEGLNEIGLHPEALKAVEGELAITEDKHTLWRAVTTALLNKRYSLAAEYADRLKALPAIDASHIKIISLAYNFADRHAEAYSICHEAVDGAGHHVEIEPYTLACRATCVGRNEEAFRNIILSLRQQAPSDETLMRKAFLDSELDGAWDYAATHEPDMEKALLLGYHGWEKVVEENRPVEPERSVDHRDLTHMPAEFHRLLRPSCPATFHSIPLTTARDPALYRRYLEWQGEMAAPRIDAFARFMGKAAKILDDSQGLFASFQAERHRFGAARVHLLRLLRTAPDCNPARLPAIPLLDPLLREFQAQFDESPDAFALLVHRQSPGLTPEEVAGLPPINRGSGTAALLLGNGHFERDGYEEAIQAFSECAKIWPWDATPLLNLVRTLVETGRLKDATEVIAAIRPQALSTELRGKLERNVAEGWWAEDIYEGPREIPLPEFGGFYPGANREFLDSLRRKSETPAKSPQPTRRRRQNPRKSSPSRA